MLKCEKMHFETINMLDKMMMHGWVWWHMPVITALRRLR
jgi:hypothetical protein